MRVTALKCGVDETEALKVLVATVKPAVSRKNVTRTPTQAEVAQRSEG